MMKKIFLAFAAILWAGASASAAETYKYSYDEMGRLIKAEASGGLVISYKYDASGNLLRREISSTVQPASATGRKKAPQSKAAPAKGSR